MPGSTGSIGIFDSGVGGLSILQAVRHILPAEPITYVADQVHVPYGSRDQSEVRKFSEGISRFLVKQGCKMIIVACNAASATALFHLRSRFSETPFIGMEPAVKPAAEYTQSGVVGVLATPATFQGALYASVVERFANGVEILQDTCPGLVSQIEAGYLQTIETRVILEKALLPMLARNIDTVVLGCTHYPFVIPLIQDIVGDSVRVIDPAPAIARQASRILDFHDIRCPADQKEPASGLEQGEVKIFTSGDPRQLSRLLPQLIHREWAVMQVCWDETDLDCC